MDPAHGGADRQPPTTPIVAVADDSEAHATSLPSDPPAPSPRMNPDIDLGSRLSTLHISEADQPQDPPSSSSTEHLSSTEPEGRTPGEQAVQQADVGDDAVERVVPEASADGDEHEHEHAAPQEVTNVPGSLQEDVPSEQRGEPAQSAPQPSLPDVPQNTEDASSSGDELQTAPIERRLTLLEALNETRDSADDYTNTPRATGTGSYDSRRTGPITTSAPLPPSPPLPPAQHTRPPASRLTSEFSLPRWQPDAEVTLCPICSTQFGIFVRKHHCRKCGRVVCNSCSPHRIVIPYQYIVRPPGEYPFPPFPQPGEEGGIADFSSISGGERVRLCNPCVPDPNITPPRPQAFAGEHSTRPPHQRSYSGSSVVTGLESSSSSSHFQQYPTSPRGDGHARRRSITVNSGAGPSQMPGPSGYHSRSARLPGDRHGYYPATYSSSSAHTGYGSRRQGRDSHDSSRLQSSINRPLPPAPQIPEEDECPVCHLELPSRDLPDSETLREAHINDCITYHSAYNPRRATLMGGTPGAHGTPPPRTERRTGMFPYVATEKDCVDDAECTICFEEYEAGDQMCRLECLCRFHRACIAAWFETRPGRCPVHQHDSYGY